MSHEATSLGLNQDEAAFFQHVLSHDGSSEGGSPQANEGVGKRDIEDQSHAGAASSLRALEGAGIGMDEQAAGGLSARFADSTSSTGSAESPFNRIDGTSTSASARSTRNPVQPERRARQHGKAKSSPKASAARPQQPTCQLDGQWQDVSPELRDTLEIRLADIEVCCSRLNPHAQLSRVKP